MQSAGFYYSTNSLPCCRQALVQAIFTIVKTSWQTWDQLANIQSTLYSKNSTPCCHGASYFCYSKDQLANVGPAGKYKKHPMFTIIGVSQQQSTIVRSIACFVAGWHRVFCMFASWPHVCQLVFTIAKIDWPSATGHAIFAIAKASWQTWHQLANTQNAL